LTVKKETYIYGIRPAIEAMKAGKEFEKILIQHGLKGEGFKEMFSLIRDLEIAYQFVPVEKLNRLSRQNHQGVIAFVSEISYYKAEDLVPFIYDQGKVPLIIVLDRVTDVRNLGSIARTAECAGVDGIILPARGSAMINSDAIKTSAGALYKIPVVKSQNLKETLQYLKDSGLFIMAASEKADIEYTSADFCKPLAVLMGSEGEGISGEYLKMADEIVMIPIQGEIASLNVSVAAGVLVYEALRQRGVK
jgi:23S rRNA (guanosine2251-2'-O)-methyltransferase